MNNEETMQHEALVSKICYRPIASRSRGQYLKRPCGKPVYKYGLCKRCYERQWGFLSK